MFFSKKKKKWRQNNTHTHTHEMYKRKIINRFQFFFCRNSQGTKPVGVARGGRVHHRSHDPLTGRSFAVKKFRGKKKMFASVCASFQFFLEDKWLHLRFVIFSKFSSRTKKKFLKKKKKSTTWFAFGRGRGEFSFKNLIFNLKKKNKWISSPGNGEEVKDHILISVLDGQMNRTPTFPISQLRIRTVSHLFATRKTKQINFNVPFQVELYFFQ